MSRVQQCEQEQPKPVQIFAPLSFALIPGTYYTSAEHLLQQLAVFCVAVVTALDVRDAKVFLLYHAAVTWCSPPDRTRALL